MVSKQDKHSAKRKKFSGTIQLVLAFLVWIFFIGKWSGLVLHGKLGFLVNNYSNLLVLTITFVVFIVISVVKKAFWKPLFSVLYFYLRILVFPLVAIYKIIKLLLSFMKAISLITKLPMRIEIQLIGLFFAIVSSYLIFRYHESGIIYTAMAILSLFIVIAYVSLYSWTKNPLGLLNRAVLLCERLMNWVGRKFYGTQSNLDEKSESKLIKDLDYHISSYKLYDAIEISLLKEIDRNSLKHTLVNWFLLLWFMVLLVTIFGFSFLYYASFKINETSFIGSVYIYWDFLYFSCLTFTTMTFGQITPSVPITKLLVVFQLFATFYHLIIVVLTFSTITEDSATKMVNSLQRKVSSKKESIIRGVGQKHKIPKEMFISLKRAQDFYKDEKN